MPNVCVKDMYVCLVPHNVERQNSRNSKTLYMDNAVSLESMPPRQPVFSDQCSISHFLSLLPLLTSGSCSVNRGSSKRFAWPGICMIRSPSHSHSQYAHNWMYCFLSCTQLVRPICMTKKLSQEVWQHFLVTPDLGFMEITKTVLCEVVATLTDFEKLQFYYENGRLFPVFQYFHSWNFFIWV